MNEKFLNIIIKGIWNWNKNTIICFFVFVSQPAPGNFGESILSSALDCSGSSAVSQRNRALRVHWRRAEGRKASGRRVEEGLQQWQELWSDTGCCHSPGTTPGPICPSEKGKYKTGWYSGFLGWAILDIHFPFRPLVPPSKLCSLTYRVTSVLFLKPSDTQGMWRGQSTHSNVLCLVPNLAHRRLSINSGPNQLINAS